MLPPESLGGGTVISGTSYSLQTGSGGTVTALIVGRVTPSLPTPSATLPAAYSIGESTEVILPNNETLRPDSVTTVNEVPVSLAASNSAVVIARTP